MKSIAISAVFAGALTLGGIGAAQAWEPSKPIEFVVTSAPAAAPTISPASSSRSSRSTNSPSSRSWW